jgi:hypothetical protein
MSEIKQLTAAMVKVQATLKHAVKDSTNPHFKSKYADLGAVWDACRETLTANELAVFQTMDVLHVAQRDGATVIQPVLNTILAHVSGESIESTTPIVMKDRDNPQQMGSAITYARRYALMAILGIVADDDDGQAAATPIVRRDAVEIMAGGDLKPLRNRLYKLVEGEVETDEDETAIRNWILSLDFKQLSQAIKERET